MQHSHFIRKLPVEKVPLIYSKRILDRRRLQIDIGDTFTGLTVKEIEEIVELRERYAAIILILFKPWRFLHDLGKTNDTSWWSIFTAWTPTQDVSKIIEHFQDYYRAFIVVEEDKNNIKNKGFLGGEIKDGDIYDDVYDDTVMELMRKQMDDDDKKIELVPMKKPTKKIQRVVNVLQYLKSNNVEYDDMPAKEFSDVANLNSVKHCKSNVIQPPDMTPIYSTFDERKTRVFLDIIA